jgi:hypothetical protein
MKSTTFFDEDSNDGKCFIVQATTYLGIGSGTLFSVNINEGTDKVLRARTVPEYIFFQIDTYLKFKQKMNKNAFLHHSQLCTN